MAFLPFGASVTVVFYDPQANGDPLKDEADVIYGKNCEWTIDVKVLDGETAKLGIAHAIKELNIVAALEKNHCFVTDKMVNKW